MSSGIRSDARRSTRPGRPSAEATPSARSTKAVQGAQAVRELEAPSSEASHHSPQVVATVSGIWPDSPLQAGRSAQGRWQPTRFACHPVRVPGTCC